MSVRANDKWKCLCDRYTGSEDKYGFDLDTLMKWEPFFRFFYEGYFEVKLLGVENIPAEGRAILVGNHSGGLPIDAMMLLNGYLNHHSHPRRIRALVHNWLRRSALMKGIICGFGGVPATFDAAVEVLNNDELLMMYPEGPKGTGKLYNLRYRLFDFNPGFVRAAIMTGAPIVPVVTIGGDDLYPIINDARLLARFLSMPYFPVTPTFPWLPVFSGCVPLPAKMLIKIGRPIYLDYPEECANDKELRLKIAREIQFDIQLEINRLLEVRKGIFGGWDDKDLAA